MQHETSVESDSIVMVESTETAEIQSAVGEAVISEIIPNADMLIRPLTICTTSKSIYIQRIKEASFYCRLWLN